MVVAMLMMTRAADVEQDYLFGICRSIGDKLISNDKQNACKVEPGSAGQNPADQEDHGGSAPGQQSEPFFQIFINGDYLIVVIRFEEELADDNTAQNRAYAELGIGEVAGMVAFPRRSQEGGRADFRSQDGGQDGPPGQGTVSQSIIRQGFCLRPA